MDIVMVLILMNLPTILLSIGFLAGLYILDRYFGI